MKHIDDGSADKRPIIAAMMKSPKGGMNMRSPTNQTQTRSRSKKNQRARAQTFTFKKEVSKKEDKVAESGIL